jgi:hypothetical protein
MVSADVGAKFTPLNRPAGPGDRRVTIWPMTEATQGKSGGRVSVEGDGANRERARKQLCPPRRPEEILGAGA